MAIAAARFPPPPPPPAAPCRYRPPVACRSRILSHVTATDALASVGIAPPPPPAVPHAPRTREKHQKQPEVIIDDGEDERRLGVIDFVERTKEMIGSDDGRGPPRWFTPLDCDGRSRIAGAPVLLYLPGIDGIGLGLIPHHHKLKKIFDIWCLHIPVHDRTPFEGLVEFVERTLRFENAHLQKKPIYLVGESLGACLAFAVAARNPDIDLMIVAVNPATSFCTSLLQYFLSLFDVIPDQLHHMMPNILKFTANSMRMTRAYAENGLQQSSGVLAESVSSMFSYLSLLADILPRESLLWKMKILKPASLYANSRLYAVRAQMLILASGKDQLFSSKEEAERICRVVSNCRFRLFKDSDHVVLLESTVDLITVIKGACFYRRSGRKNYVSDYLMPSSNEFQKIKDQYRWYNAAVSSVMLSTLEDGKIVRGLTGIPSKGPVIFVGYHQLMGVELGPLIIEFLTKKNILLRGLAHPFLFDGTSEQILPDKSLFDVTRIMGAVPVTGLNFYNLLSEKQFVLLFPGGLREALHKKGEQYKLFWPEQSEFIRMASRFGATIVPFGVVGEDDISELVLDYDDLSNIPFHDDFLESLNQEAMKLRIDSTGEVKNQYLHCPIMLPKIPGRFYYLFGRPIETKGRMKELKNKERAHELYLHVKSEVECCLSYLKEKREKDPYRNILARLMYQATNGFTSEVPTFDL